MPGIFINDGGATSSALGNALGGLANSMSPEAQAKAKLLWLQSEGQDIGNQRDIDKLQGTEDAADPSVAGTLSRLGQPGVDINAPITFGNPYRDAGGRVSHVGRPTTAGGAVISNRILQGGDANDIRSAVTLSQQGSPSIGPGNTFDDQSAIARSRAAPQTVSPGNKVYIDPAKGDVPGNVLTGGSTAEQEEQSSTVKQADSDQKAGPGAADAVATLTQLQALRQSVISQGANFSPTDVGFQAAAQKLDGIIGVPFFTRMNQQQDVLDAITKRMKMITAATRTAYAGDPTLRGLAEQLDEGLPDPRSDQFNASANALKRALQAQIEDARAAAELQANPGSATAADAYRRGKLARHQAALEEALKANAPPPVETPPPPVVTPPPPANEPPVKHYRWNPTTHKSELIQ